MWAKSYSIRAVIAVGLLVGIHAVLLTVCAIVLGGGLLLFAAIVNGMAGEQITPKLGLFLSALLVLLFVGLLRRLIWCWPRWSDPGFRVTAAEHPRLFALIEEVAHAMKTKMPAEVYFIPTVNACAATRGGFLGLHGRRVLGLGAPLIANANVSQLAATIAHELGHFAGGETRLNAVIYATRQALTDTVQNIGNSDLRFLRRPFEWLLRIYLRVTQSISRQQELLADTWSVRIAGKDAHTSALEASAIQSAAFDLYMREEIAPLSVHGCTVDNLLEGYRRYLCSRRFTTLRPGLEAELHKTHTRKVDSHPELAERLKFALGIEDGARPIDNTPAWDLLNDPLQVEAKVSEYGRPKELQPLTWDEIGPRLARNWRGPAVNIQRRLPGFGLQEWIRIASDDSEGHVEQERFVEIVAPRFRGHHVATRAADLRGETHRQLSFWLAALLAENGYRWHLTPGEPVTVVGADRVVETGEFVGRVLDGKEPAENVKSFAPALAGADVQVCLDEEERTKPLVRSPIRLKIRRHWAEATFPLEDVFLPACCPVCASPATKVVPAVVPLGRSPYADRLQFWLFPCDEHESEALSAIGIQAVDLERHTITLDIKHQRYARVLEQCLQ